jgi:hypothetical protein
MDGNTGFTIFPTSWGSYSQFIVTTYRMIQKESATQCGPINLLNLSKEVLSTWVQFKKDEES